ncbi:MAG: GNAT family N-acetyltransferase [Sphingomonas sp.]|nr:GNAT family N-acetyltransferase [Sphingomonas sp.]
MSVRPASAADVAALGIIGPAAYAEAYGGWWTSAAGLARHLESFGAAAFAALLADPGARVWVAEQQGAVVGFLTLHLDSPDPIRGRASGGECRRVYLLRAAMGQGLGRALCDAAVEAARAAGLDHLWLDVMAEAPWAVNAYRAWGFEEIGRKQFHNALRGDLREMIVMARGV